MMIRVSRRRRRRRRLGAVEIREEKKEGRKEGRKVLKVLLWSLVLDADEQTGDGGVAAALSGVQLSYCCCFS
jgi:hypothetical protein